MSNYRALIFWMVVVGAIFVYIWRSGQLAKLVVFVSETSEEMKKCNWPTWSELKGSTVVVMIALVAMGAFTVISDKIFALGTYGISALMH
jgi:preprotein translocase subunit SecE